VIANQVFAQQTHISRFPVQGIGLTGVIRTEVNYVVASIDAYLVIAHIFRAHSHLGIDHLVGVVEDVGGEGISPL